MTPPTARNGDRTRTVAASALDALHFALDRSSPVPLYYQLAQQLESAIEHGALAPGNLLGNEIDLSTRLGLSRPTVRQAIQSLVDKGLLVPPGVRAGVGHAASRGGWPTAVWAGWGWVVFLR
ncbi:GntR family transcriptional regulator, partial [Streptomyces sp. NPDC002920]